MVENASPVWQAILIPNTEENSQALVIALRKLLEDENFAVYDPFPGGIGSPIGKVLRLRFFVTPVVEGWQRVLVGDEAPVALVDGLAAAMGTALLNVQLLAGPTYEIMVHYPDRSPQATLVALMPFLRPDKTSDDLLQAAEGLVTTSDPAADSLPTELQQLAKQHGVEGQQLDKLMGRLTKQVFDKMGQGESAQEQARAALTGLSQGIDWNNAAVQQLLGIMACLTVPADWYLPDFGSVVAAYQIARQVRRGDTLLLPGDKTALEKLPNALDYTPLYYYKRLP